MSRFTNTLAGIFLPNRPAPSLSQTFSAAVGAYRSRRQLATLDADQLNDIGISEKAAQQEAARPIWDVPSHWIQ